VKSDVVVVGAGLAGLSAARDLMNQGADVIVLEARNRPGGRVEQTTLADGRIVQLGGEVIGPFHRAYVELVEELGLTIVPSFPRLPGEDTWVLADGRYVGDGFPWMSDADRHSYAALNEEFGKLARWTPGRAATSPAGAPAT
jgi:monoamine oxidase